MSISYPTIVAFPRTAPYLRMRSAEFWTLIAIIGVTGLFRLFASGGDFWIGEVSAWQIARQVSSPLQILTAAQSHIDQNHPLNTLFIYLLGDRPFWAVYRILALISGIATVVLAARVMLHFGHTTCIIAAILVGCSFPLLNYSSEASGFAPMVFLALLAFWSMQRYLQKSSTRDATIFSIACILGLLSHVCFLQFYIAILIHSLYVQLSRGHAVRQAIRALLACHSLPLAFFVVYFVVFIRHLPAASGPAASPLVPMLSSLALMVGGPTDTAITAYLAVVAAVALLSALDWIGSRRTDLLVFFVLVLVIGPAIQLLLVRRPVPSSPGYFLTAITFGLLLFSTRLASMFHARGRDRLIAIILMVLMFAGNAYQIARYLMEGPGHYRDAVYYIAHHTDDPLVTIVARSAVPDEVPRLQDMLNFYSRYLPEDKKFGFEETIPSLPAPQWLIVKTYRVGGPLFKKIDMPDVGVDGATYIFDHEFGYYGLSGSSWQVYRLQVNR